MTCLRENLNGANLLIGYLEGTLSTEERAELDQHASTCAECRELLAVQQTLVDDVPEVSADFDARLYERIQQDTQNQWWRRLLWRPMVPLAAAAAMMAVALWVHPPALNAPSVDEPKASVDRVEIEQLEQALDDVELLMPVNKTPATL